ncbi:uncharacterized protein METZ01_LOCUS271475, partial [marine metagenome]
ELEGDLREEADLYRQNLIETVAEFDDEALEVWMECGDLSRDLLNRAIRKGVLAGKIFPAYSGSSLHNKGVQLVIDGVVDFLPSPLDSPEVRGHIPESEKELIRHVQKDKSLCALAFKTATDQHGELTYVRVYTGKLKSSSGVFNPRVGRMERITRIFRMFSNDRDPVDSAGPGEIVTVIGFKKTVTGDTLCEKQDPIQLESMQFPEPVVSVAIEPKTSADRDKLEEVLQRLAKDDPTFRVTSDIETGQTLIHAMGELHAEILLHRITQEFRVPASTGEPRVAYRESLNMTTRGDEESQIKVGEKTLFGHVVVELRKNPKSVTPSYREELDPVLAKELKPYLPSIKEGLLSAAGSGPIAGYPMVYLDVVLVGGSVSPDSDERAYSMSAATAVRKAYGGGKPALLEPHMQFEVTVPEQFMGDVINDLNSR